MERAALRKGKAGKSSSKKLSTDPSKKRGSSGKGQGTLAWIPANTNRCWVLGKRGDKNPEVSGDVRTPRTGIVSGTLYAHLISSATLELGGLWPEGETNITCKTTFILPGDHLPQRPDSMFIHPDTMQLCGFGIAQPVVVRNLDSQVCSHCAMTCMARLNGVTL